MTMSTPTLQRGRTLPDLGDEQSGRLSPRGIDERTIGRDWVAARLWLKKRLDGAA